MQPDFLRSASDIPLPLLQGAEDTAVHALEISTLLNLAEGYTRLVPGALIGWKRTNIVVRYGKHRHFVEYLRAVFLIVVVELQLRELLLQKNYSCLGVLQSIAVPVLIQKSA